MLEGERKYVRRVVERKLRGRRLRGWLWFLITAGSIEIMLG